MEVLQAFVAAKNYYLPYWSIVSGQTRKEGYLFSPRKLVRSNHHWNKKANVITSNLYYSEDTKNHRENEGIQVLLEMIT